MTASVSLQKFVIHGDNRGSLIALENEHNLPFEVKRVYYIFNTKQGVSRGFHAHRRLRQVLIVISGGCDIKVEYQGKSETYHLSKPDEGLLIEGLVWREMHNFTPDCVLMVLADAYYDETDYIRDYNDFLKAEKND